MWRQWFVSAWLHAGCLPWACCGGRAQGSKEALPQRGDKTPQTRNLGFNAAFEAELQELGPISVDEFARLYAPTDYLTNKVGTPRPLSFGIG